MYGLRWTLDESPTALVTMLVDPRARSKRESQLREGCREAGRALLAPLLPLLREHKTRVVGFSLPETLAHIPFEALMTDAGVCGDEFEVFYLPGLSVLWDLTRRGPPVTPARVLVVMYAGTDLKQTAEELLGLQRAWNARLTTLPTSTCTKGDVLRELTGDYDYIHVMGHGEFDLLDPMNSAMHLVRDPTRDSQRVTARDLLSVRFKRSPIITLSACSTGLSWGLAANDYRGLRGSLQRAGARGVVASRWEVYDDAARAFMVSLHERLAREEGGGIVSHVSAAQAEMRPRVPIEDWAAFAYLGVPYCSRADKESIDTVRSLLIVI